MLTRKRTKTFRPQLESLESRQMLSITASLSGGVLSIVGTNQADTATVNRTHTAITIAETGQSFAVKQVKAIDVALLEGDDILQFNNFNKKGKQVSGWIKIAVNAEAGGGDDAFINTKSQTIYYGGNLDNLSVKKGGKELINGEKPTWFDFTLIASDVRNTAKQEFFGNKKVLNRNGMLNVFDAVANSGDVSQNEFTSLTTLVNNNSLYKGVQYVQVLAGYVVKGTVANTYYQGDTLGNLEVGSTKEHLETLVSKWYLGTDLPAVTLVGPDGNQYYPEYRAVAGQLYVNGIHYQDTNDPQFDSVNQGDLGDCYYLAALGAIAKQSAKPIRNMFIDNGDGTFTVRFFDNGKQNSVYYVTVNRDLPTNPDSGVLVYAGAGKMYNDPNNELWVALAEKAYAQVAEFGWVKGGGQAGINSYEAIIGGFAGDAMADVLGKPSSPGLDLDGKAQFEAIAKFKSGAPVSFSSKNPSLDPRVPGGHAYAMIGYDAQTQKFQLYNPWGVDSGEAKAQFWLSWSEMSNVFYRWCYGTRIG